VGRGGRGFPPWRSRELVMDAWEQGPQFTAGGLRISVLCAKGASPVMAVSAKAGRFYYAEKIQGELTGALDPGHEWVTDFIERAKRKKVEQDDFLERSPIGLTRLLLAL
jgi:hypothetical protein